MRKLTLLVTLVVASAFFLAPGTASAANCTSATAGAIQRAYGIPAPSWFLTNDIVSGCTGVNAVRFNTQANNTGTHLVDLSLCSPNCFEVAPYTFNGNTWPNVPNPSVVLGPSPGPYYGQATWGCWFSGSHKLDHGFTYAIRNSNGNTWGPDHTVWIATPTFVTGC